MRKLRQVLLVLFSVVALSFATTSGPIYPTAATGNSATLGGGTFAWTNPGNIVSDNVTYATVVPATGGKTDDLRAGTFGFAIPGGATVVGIQVFVNVFANSTGAEAWNVVALEGGGAATANRASQGTNLNTVLTVYTFGGTADLWGTTWTPAQINAAGFVANVSYGPAIASPGTISVDSISVTVSYSIDTMGHRRVIIAQTRSARRA